MSWKLLVDNLNNSNSIWGQSEDWIDLDFNPQGIRSIAYEGDHWISSYCLLLHASD